MNHALNYTNQVPAGFYHNPNTGMLHVTDYQHDSAAYGSHLQAPANDQTEWQRLKQQLGPQHVNSAYGLDAVNPFVGVGYHHVKEL